MPYGGSTDFALRGPASTDVSTDPSTLVRLPHGNCTGGAPLDPSSWPADAFCFTAEQNSQHGRDGHRLRGGVKASTLRRGATSGGGGRLYYKPHVQESPRQLKSSRISRARVGQVKSSDRERMSHAGVRRDDEESTGDGEVAEALLYAGWPTPFRVSNASDVVLVNLRVCVFHHHMCIAVRRRCRFVPVSPTYTLLPVRFTCPHVFCSCVSSVECMLLILALPSCSV